MPTSKKQISKRLPEIYTAFLGGIQSNDFTEFFNLLDQKPMIAMMGYCAYKGTVPEPLRQTLEKQKEHILKALAEEDDPGDKKALQEMLVSMDKKLKKHFKVICINNIDVSTVRTLSQDEQGGVYTYKDSGGVYTYKDSIFVATKGKTREEVFAILLHETAHFIMNKIFENKGLPYRSDDVNARQKFGKILTNLHDSFDEIEMNINDQMELEAFLDLKVVYTKYDEDEWEKELIVRIPSILTRMGPEKGRSWLEKNAPLLYEYYKIEIVSEINHYLANKNIEEFMSGFDSPELKISLQQKI